MTHRSVEVPVIARVEGEGALHITLDGDEIVDLRLQIYEPPRFFESFLRGRHFSDVSDIVPRICGICPVAYQMSAIHGLERLFEVEVSEGTHELRRLLYCAEWIESHMLHVHLLAAPDFLGFDSAIEMAQRGFKAEVERGLRIKRLGNDLLALIGGREIHPVSPMVGGFSKAPRPRDLRALEPRFEEALAEILEVADWVGTLTYPSFPRAAELVSMVDPDEYPMNVGDMASTSGRHWAADAYEDETHELHVEHSNALHSVFTDTGAEYFLGPLARINLNEATLTPVARDAARRAGLAALPDPDPFRSMAARVAETALALEESLRLIRAYVPPDPPLVAGASARRAGDLDHRGAARHALPPLRRGGRRDDPGGEDRSADLPEPPAHGAGPPGVPPVGARAAGGRADAPVRDGGAQLRPMHLVRDPLPAGRRRAPLRPGVAARSDRRLWEPRCGRRRGGTRRRRTGATASFRPTSRS